MNTPPPVTLPGSRAVSELGAHLGALTTITLWHDILCPWCYVALFQAHKLTAEFGVMFDWRGAELFPPALNYQPSPPRPVDPNAPPASKSRFDLFAEAEGVEMPSPRPAFTSMHPALLALEYATVKEGPTKGDALNTALYRAFWEQQTDIADHAALARIAESVGIVSAPLLESVAGEEFAANIVGFDDDAYAAGIRHVPTFVFGGEERLAEAPYADLARATDRFLIRAEKYRGQ